MVRTKTRAALKGRVDQYQVWTCLLPRICIPALKLLFLIGTNKFYNADKYILQEVQMQLQLETCTKCLDSPVSGNLHPSDYRPAAEASTTTWWDIVKKNRRIKMQMNDEQIIRLPRKNRCNRNDSTRYFWASHSVLACRMKGKIKSIKKNQHLSAEKKRYANYRRSSREKTCITKGFSPHSPLPDNTLPSFTFENTKKDRHKLCHTIANAKTKVLMET